METLVSQLNNFYLKSFKPPYIYLSITVAATLSCVIVGLCYTIYKQRQPIVISNLPKKSKTKKKRQEKDKSNSEEKKEGGQERDKSESPMAGCPMFGANEFSAGQWPVDESNLKKNKKNIDLQAEVGDPVEYCGHIQSVLKKAQHRVQTKAIQEEMTSEQLASEREIQREQLENIFKLMNDQKDKFGVDGIDDINNQMKLYM